MLRLTFFLCLGMLAALYTLGEDNGQLRPGLAKAAAEGRLDEVWAEARARAEPTPAPVPVAEPTPVVAEAPPERIPLPEPEPEPVLANAGPAIEAGVEVQPGREVVHLVEEPVFSLSALGNEAVPGSDGAPVATAAAPEPAPVAVDGGTIWYVNASSVNVRSGPSTDAEILDRLGNGEATLLVAAVNDEWARIVIQGDGLEGYVALQYLSPEAP